jgi:hypothetical protein
MQIGPMSPFSSPYTSRAASGPETIWRTGKFQQVVPNSVFVIMSFEGKGMNRVLTVIKEECNALQLEAKRADDHKGSHVVMAKIAEEIEKAELIICDLTYERPNVYYELGYAHGVGNGGERILLIAGTKTEVHFDIKLLRNERYSSTQALRLILRENLPDMLRQCRSKQAVESGSGPLGTPMHTEPVAGPVILSREPQPKR